MDTEHAVIPTRSRKQAMEWSLVLTSQGIDSIIQSPDEEHGWQLTVDPADYARAHEALELYRSENRSRRWRQELPLGGLVFDWRCLGWFIFIALIFLFSENSVSYRSAGVMDTQKVWDGQWWRLFTAVTLHNDLPHLISNLTFGAVLVGLAMGSFGPGMALLASYLAGVGGNVALLFIYPSDHRSLGASGLVMGALGLLTGQSIALLRAGLTAGQFIVRGILAGFMLLVLLGFNPETDVVAHVGGFIAGVGLGAALGFSGKKLAKNAWANWVAAFCCGGMVVLTWWLAFRIQ